jgi:demethoxyubiquinone hydroxylase (CLK1/Coq7/Cat5 family)
MDDARASLVAILRLAYSGELAAGYAYHGHWKSVSDPAERERIRTIEDEEWHHRRLVGEMLAGLGGHPSGLREARAYVIGRCLGMLCHVAGWLAPMYGAGRLESRNIREYEDAARHAEACGHPELVECLLGMAETEWEHEAYFRSKVEGHRLARLLPLWPRPPAKETIRAGRVAARGVA